MFWPVSAGFSKPFFNILWPVSAGLSKPFFFCFAGLSEPFFFFFCCGLFQPSSPNSFVIFINSFGWNRNSFSNNNVGILKFSVLTLERFANNCFPFSNLHLVFVSHDFHKFLFYNIFSHSSLPSFLFLFLFLFFQWIFLDSKRKTVFFKRWSTECFCEDVGGDVFGVDVLKSNGLVELFFHK